MGGNSSLRSDGRCRRARRCDPIRLALDVKHNRLAASGAAARAPHRPRPAIEEPKTHQQFQRPHHDIQRNGEQKERRTLQGMGAIACFLESLGPDRELAPASFSIQPIPDLQRRRREHLERVGAHRRPSLRVADQHAGILSCQIRREVAFRRSPHHHFDLLAEPSRRKSSARLRTDRLVAQFPSFQIQVQWTVFGIDAVAIDISHPGTRPGSQLRPRPDLHRIVPPRGSHHLVDHDRSRAAFQPANQKACQQDSPHCRLPRESLCARGSTRIVSRSLAPFTRMSSSMDSSRRSSDLHVLARSQDLRRLLGSIRPDSSDASRTNGAIRALHGAIASCPIRTILASALIFDVPTGTFKTLSGRPGSTKLSNGSNFSPLPSRFPRRTTTTGGRAPHTSNRNVAFSRFPKPSKVGHPSRWSTTESISQHREGHSPLTPTTNSRGQRLGTRLCFHCDQPPTSITERDGAHATNIDATANHWIHFRQTRNRGGIMGGNSSLRSDGRRRKGEIKRPAGIASDGPSHRGSFGFIPERLRRCARRR